MKSSDSWHARFALFTRYQNDLRPSKRWEIDEKLQSEIHNRAFIIERPLFVESYSKFTHVPQVPGGFVYGDLQWYLIYISNPNKHCASAKHYFEPYLWKKSYTEKSHVWFNQAKSPDIILFSLKIMGKLCYCVVFN